MQNKIRILIVFAFLFILNNISGQSLTFEIDKLGDSDTLTIKIYCNNESRISLNEQISIFKNDSIFKANIRSNFVTNIDTLITLDRQQIETIRNYQLSIINGDILPNFSTIHRLALIHKIENSDFVITRQTYAGQEYSLAYSLTRIE